MDAKRSIGKEKYVNWVLERINDNDRCVMMCGTPYYTVLDNSNDVRCNITIDRLENETEHQKENCQLLCIECNRSKRWTIIFLNLKQLLGWIDKFEENS